MAVRDKKRHTSERENVSKSISYDSCFKIMVSEHEEQTNNCEVTRKYSGS
jgi:hypothetical protein